VAVGNKKRLFSKWKPPRLVVITMVRSAKESVLSAFDISYDIFCGMTKLLTCLSLMYFRRLVPDLVGPEIILTIFN